MKKHAPFIIGSLLSVLASCGRTALEGGPPAPDASGRFDVLNDTATAPCDWNELGTFIGDLTPDMQGATQSARACDVPVIPSDVYRWTSVVRGTYVFESNGGPAAITAIGYGVSDCDTTAFSCGENVTTVDGGETLAIVVQEPFVLTSITALSEHCSDGRDNDFDRLVDCDDPDCIAWSPNCRATEQRCDDGIDDDDDGLIDCADDDCWNDPACDAPSEIDCSNGLDDDGDGLIDCGDLDCTDRFECMVEVECADGRDNDNDGLRDCQDPDCVDGPDCGERELVCDDGVDDDDDDLVDCEDPDCSVFEFCIERECNDGRDNDRDQRIDCEDPDCFNVRPCAGPTVEVECYDGRDEDNDGLIDCDDPDCIAAGRCQENNCTDLRDNDFDGAADCFDSDCVDRPECMTETRCGDGVDNDADGAVDCDDPDCEGTRECFIPRIERECFDGLDNDRDGATDCSDSDCRALGLCTETACDDGTDNDRDGATDCEDTDCRNVPACVFTEFECDDDIDNDGDGQTDCADDDCDDRVECLVTENEFACADGRDNDNDGATDCDDDDCAMQPECTNPCGAIDIGQTLGLVATGTTRDGTAENFGTCGGRNAPELIYQWTAPENGLYMVLLEGRGYDPLLYIRNGCAGDERACNDDIQTGVVRDSRIVFTAAAGRAYTLFADGFGNSAGVFQLSIERVPDQETDCGDRQDNDFDGDIDCADADCLDEPECGP